MTKCDFLCNNDNRRKVSNDNKKTDDLKMIEGQDDGENKFYYNMGKISSSCLGCVMMRKKGKVEIVVPVRYQAWTNW